MFSNNEYAELESELKACEKAHQALIERNANLEAELTRLRESRVAQLREIERLEQRAAELSEKLGTLRALYDKALREELEGLRRRTEAAEKRVAELERALDVETAQTRANADAFEKLSDGYLQRAEVAEAALSSARELLENADREAKVNPRYMLRTKEIGFDAALRLLRAHSKPATPACYACEAASAPRSACPLCGKIVCDLCADAEGESCCDAADPATPAATGAEPTGAVELMRIERELARAEKERET